MNTSLQNLINELSKYETFGILGLGKEGKSFLQFSEKYFPEKKIIIFDKFLDKQRFLEENKNINKNRVKNIKVYTGESYKDNFKDADIIIKAPGISCFHENISDADIQKYNISSLSDLFLQHFGHQTIGITGTKGKSTTASLLQYLFLQSKKYIENSVFLVGNIGKPVFDILHEVQGNSIIIHEFSSHQLENIHVGPCVAILLNLFPEHLDYYKDAKAYFLAKLNIFKCSPTSQKNYISIENTKTQNIQNIQNTREKKYFINTKEEKKNTEKYLQKIHTPSVHHDTIRIAKIITEIYNIFPENSEENFIHAVNRFVSLPHRLEVVESKNMKKITFINDSISTIPESTIEGIKSVVKINKNLNSIILGGFNREVDLNPLANYIKSSDIQNIYVIAETGKILEKLFKKYEKISGENTQNIVYRETLAEIFPMIYENAQENSACLFSPSAASFDQYKNFEERGNHFKDLVSLL